ncbi:MAG: hypothetical protein ACFFE8_13825 [Candidatus Heimdallarchaeota archaeon]
MKSPNSPKNCSICGEAYYASYKAKYYCVKHLERVLKAEGKDLASGISKPEK